MTGATRWPESRFAGSTNGSSGSGLAAASASQFLPDNELEPRPDVVYCADFCIDEPQRQGYGTNRIFRNIRGDLGSLLGPGNPDRAVRFDAFDEWGEIPLEFGSAAGKEVANVYASAKPRRNADIRRAFINQFIVVTGRLFDEHAAAGLEAQLLR